MRPLKSHFPDHALTTLDTLRKQTKEARVFRRAQAVREVVAGHHINAVSEAFHVANSALRKWVQRWFCRKFCSGGHAGQLPLSVKEIRQPESGTIRPQCDLRLRPRPPSVVS